MFTYYLVHNLEIIHGANNVRILVKVAQQRGLKAENCWVMKDNKRNKLATQQLKRGLL